MNVMVDIILPNTMLQNYLFSSILTISDIVHVTAKVRKTEIIIIIYYPYIYIYIFALMNYFVVIDCANCKLLTGKSTKGYANI